MCNDREIAKNLIYVIAQLSDTYDWEGREIWLSHPNRALGGITPIEAMRRGMWNELKTQADILAGGPIIATE